MAISAGRKIRTAMSVFVLFITAAMLLTKYVYLPIILKQAIPEINWTEGGFHLIMVVMAILMYDPETGKALFTQVLSKLPFGKSSS